MTRRGILGVALVSAQLFSCSDESGNDHGPYWEHEKVTPTFSVQQDNVSVTFEGHVFPTTTFILGPEDGVSFTTVNAQLTVNAAAVWAYAPIVVELYDGAESDIGSKETLIAAWEVSEPETDGNIGFQESRILSRTPSWIRVHFADFSGQCVLQVLGHH